MLPTPHCLCLLEARSTLHPRYNNQKVPQMLPMTLGGQACPQVRTPVSTALGWLPHPSQGPYERWSLAAPQDMHVRGH